MSNDGKNVLLPLFVGFGVISLPILGAITNAIGLTNFGSHGHEQEQEQKEANGAEKLDLTPAKDGDIIVNASDLPEAGHAGVKDAQVATANASKATAHN